MQTIAQNFGIGNAVGAVDVNGSTINYSSGVTYYSMKGYTKITFIITGGAVGDASWSVAAYQAKAVAGTSASSTALPLTHYWHNKSSTSTTVLTRATASSSKVTLDGTNSTVTVLEYDAKQLTRASSFDCIGLGVANVGTASTFINILAILHDPRYAGDSMPVNARSD